MKKYQRVLLFPVQLLAWLYSGFLYAIASIITLSAIAALIAWILSWFGVLPID